MPRERPQKKSTDASQQKALQIKAYQQIKTTRLTGQLERVISETIPKHPLFNKKINLSKLK